jgi:hypothetical protein
MSVSEGLECVMVGNAFLGMGWHGNGNVHFGMVRNVRFSIA